jgi:stage II sporulation protein M
MGLVTCSLASVVTLMLNGIYVGVQWKLFTAHAPGWKVVALLAPHGLLEVPGMLLAGAVGMMGAAVLRSFIRGGMAGMRFCSRPALYGISISVALTLLGAVVESWNICRL